MVWIEYSDRELGGENQLKIQLSSYRQQTIAAIDSQSHCSKIHHHQEIIDF